LGDEKTPILLDTDIGSDVDDALALAYLLRQPRCDLLGITTVTGEPAVRAQLADAVCQAFGRPDVPIHSGAARPILVPQQQSEVPQEAALARWPHRDQFAPNTAVDFLRQTIRSRSGEITLLSIGSLTNIGLLFALDREIPRLLKQYVMMGGLYRSRLERYGLTEWNAKGDPHAASIVFGADVPGMRCVGLDVTTRCRMDAETCRQRLNAGPLRIILDMAEVWFQHARPEITFHDPLAAACIFEPNLCTFQTGQVEIELQSDRLRGMTHFNPNASEKPHQVAVDVKPEAFFKHFFAVVA
jgi:purine nucleosidase